MMAKSVLFAVEANMAAHCLQGPRAKLFFTHLDQSHKSPQNVPFMRLVRLLDLAFFREYKHLIDDNVCWLGSMFASTNSDFFTCPERKESYGCIVSNMCAMKYFLKNGQHVFVSRQSLNEGVSKMLAIEDGQLLGLEAVISFKRFDGEKTGAGIGAWMTKEHGDKGLLPAYVGYHSTDGASNAVASADHYGLLTEMNRDSPIYHDKCMAHQNNRSAKMASGTGDFKHCSNDELRLALTKAHTIITRVHRSTNQSKVVLDVQKAANRNHIGLPLQSVVTRWDSSNLEVASLNRMMGDFNAALTLMVQRDNGTDEDREALTFSSTDRNILRQFECGSQPCLLLSKFYQLNEATSHETLFVTTARLAQMKESSFLMFGDISHSDLSDLKTRTKTVLVYSSTHPMVNAGSGREEKPMEDCIELFRELYVKDMGIRCGIIKDNGSPVTKLPNIIAMACLLNPLYGSECERNLMVVICLSVF
jgi:hypothetical protein